MRVVVGGRILLLLSRIAGLIVVLSAILSRVAGFITTALGLAVAGGILGFICALLILLIQVFHPLRDILFSVPFKIYKESLELTCL